MSNRILLSKLLFVHHLCHLPTESLGNSFFKTQRADPKKYFGVVSECLPYLEDWNLSNIEDFTKSQWRLAIKRKIYEKQRRECLESMQGYKKIDYEECSNEKFEMKHYFRTLDIQESRMYYKIKYFLVPTVAMNFKNDKKFRAQNYLCQDCIREELGDDGNITVTKGLPNSQEHLLYECPANEDIRAGKSLNQTRDLISFFTEVIERRQSKLS